MNLTLVLSSDQFLDDNLSIRSAVRNLGEEAGYRSPIVI